MKRSLFRDKQNSMSVERKLSISEAPSENFSRGLLEVEIPELGPKISGKVRDIWVSDSGLRVMVTTDRLSAYDRVICTVPGKGQVLNLLSAFWYEETQDIVPNHLIAVPHPNVLIARQAQETLPVEVVLRRYMAKSSTSTSVYYNYADLSRREIYGIKFPDGLKPNQEFPMGTILTPTTKALTGHDQELTDQQAQEVVDGKLGESMWARTKAASFALFDRASSYLASEGLILVDTKFEFGLDKDRDLMLIDELFTPDSSRFWLGESYQQRFNAGETPKQFDKEIIRRWLADKGFKGEGIVPVVDEEIIGKVASAYRIPYTMITGKELPLPSSSDLIREAILDYRQVAES